MSKEDSFWSSMARSAGRLIPGKALGDAAYWQLMKAKVAFRRLKNEELKLQTIEDIIEQDIKAGMQKLDEMYQKNPHDLVSFGNDIAKAFFGSRRFRKGWVLDDYWEVYHMLNNYPNYQKELDGFTGL